MERKKKSISLREGLLLFDASSWGTPSL